ncbi:MAG: hypothetical protein P1U56_00815 [Saprospiraceae bacterium]|nr:hypothetical protein [Saprospiraceae bacterium]
MKRLLIFNLAIILFLGSNSIFAQSEDDKTGLLGDNFSLEGALDMFKNAANLEAFEEALNSENNYVNNLDLNDDDEIDYIRIEDNMENDIHAIVLQALISEDEVQDIAVIEIERTGDESATLQIVGDEYLYGEDVFVEAFEEEGTSSGKGGPNADSKISRIVVNVWGWPSVRFVYRPNYVVYRSPFRWRHYPRTWRPWRPLSWTVYHGKRFHYKRNYRVVHTRRVVNARKIYTPRRKSSSTVVKKSKTVTRVRTNNNGKKVATRNKTTTKVRKNKNGKVNAKTTKKSAKVKKGKNGKVKTKKTKTKKVKKRGN